MMPPRVKVSLVIATFNRGPKIAVTLDSALKQTRSFAEILLVDDCSTDNTSAFVRQRYPMVRLLQTPVNLFTSGARNFGAKMAQSSFLMFLDHDDVLHPHALETLLELVREFPEAAAAFADHEYEHAAAGVRFPDHHSAQPAFSRLRGVRPLAKRPCGRLYGRGLYRALLWGNLLQQPWLIKSECFAEIGGFAEDIRYCEDWDLYCRLVRRRKVALSDAVISRHIVEGTNLHLAPGQHDMHLRVMQRLVSESPRDFYTATVIRRRLANFDKYAGDIAAAAKRYSDARRAYCRSFARWPFDPVVAIRCLTSQFAILRNQS